MSIELDQGNFARALKSASSVADPRHQVLKNVHIVANEQNLWVMATDTVIGVTEEILLEKAATMDVTVNASRLHRVVSSLPAGPMKLSVSKTGHLCLKSGRSEFELLTIPAGDFPEIQDPEEDCLHDIDGSALLEAIESVLPSVSSDASRVNLVSALFESSGDEINVVSTDGHRLTVFTTSKMGSEFANACCDAQEVTTLIPRKVLLELRKVLGVKEIGPVKYAKSNTQLWFRIGNTTLLAKIPEVKFPPWRQVLPKESKSTATVDRVELTGMIARAVILAPDKTALLVISVQGEEISIRSENADLGTSVQTVVADYTGNEELRIGLNGNYVLEALNTMNADRVVLEFTDETGPVLIRPESSEGTSLKAIVMPMRI